MFAASLTPSGTARPAASPRHSQAPAPRGAETLVLAANGLLGLRFGASARQAERRVSALAGQAPKLTHDPLTCGLNGAATWPGLTLLLGRGRFLGYTYSATARDRLGGLETARGLVVGDSTAAGHQLYAKHFTTSWAQDGSYLISTPQGRIAGYLHATSPDGTTFTPAGRILSIGAGDEGCPAASP